MIARRTDDPAPADLRRLVVYVVWDRRGDVEEYVEHALAGLREHATHILVVVNGELTDSGRARLVPVADEILVRENRGFDIWGHKHALDHLGDRIDAFDELILTNDTWFGPVRPYGPVLTRMDSSAADFWGMTDHAREEPNPFTGTGVLFYHLQSFWIAVRRRMFRSPQWRAYWRDLPEMPGYFDAVLQHEAVFTQHFADAGFAHDVAFPSSAYPTDHPALFNPDLLLRDGCPLLKRRPLFHFPPFLDRHAVIGREVLVDVERYGYPVRLIREDLARNVAPRVANANTAALEVLSERASRPPEADAVPRVGVIVHLADAGALDEVLSYGRNLPLPADLIVTAPSSVDAAAIAARLEAVREGMISRVEVRSLPHAGVDHMSALLIGCRDLVIGAAYDILVRLVAASPRPAFFNADRFHSRYQLDNLLNSPGYAANLLDLFRQEPGLGAVFPPTVEIGGSPLGAGWGRMRDSAEALAERLRIRVPLDDVSPLAPYGGMMVFRPGALEILADQEWQYSDYAASAHSEAPLAALQERLVVYALGERGFHSRTVLTAEHADISHTALEFTLDQMSSTTPGYPVEQIQFLLRAGRAGNGGALDLARMYLRLNHPKAAGALGGAVRAAVRWLGSLRGRPGGIA